MNFTSGERRPARSSERSARGPKIESWIVKCFTIHDRIILWNITGIPCESQTTLTYSERNRGVWAKFSIKIKKVFQEHWLTYSCLCVFVCRYVFVWRHHFRARYCKSRVKKFLLNIHELTLLSLLSFQNYFWLQKWQKSLCQVCRYFSCCQSCVNFPTHDLLKNCPWAT